MTENEPQNLCAFVCDMEAWGEQEQISIESKASTAESCALFFFESSASLRRCYYISPLTACADAFIHTRARQKRTAGMDHCTFALGTYLPDHRIIRSALLLIDQRFHHTCCVRACVRVRVRGECQLTEKN